MPIADRRVYLSFVVGFLVCFVVAIALQKADSNPVQTVAERFPRDIVEAYRLGVKDALKTNPASWDLEQACLELWANKQVKK